MENFGIKLDRVKQPEPSIPQNNGTKRIIQNPYVGIISDINPTSTPISDTLTIREQENPKQKHKPFLYKSSPLNFNNLASGGIIVCGILAIISLFKK